MKFKQRLILISTLLLILALACNLSPQPSQPASDAGAVETKVAQTVAAQVNQDQPPADQEDTNPPADDNNDQQPPAEDPTATPEPTATFTPEPTATPEPTDTPEPPPSAVSALNLGSADATYNFNNKGTFYTYTDTDSKVEIKDGTLQFTIFDAIGWTIWSFSAIELEDFYFEINVTMPANCVGKDRGGIIFGTPLGEKDKGINYQVSCDGYYRLFIWDGSVTTNLIPWTENSEINEGPNSTNRLGVLRKGNKITLYLNGLLMDSVTDNTYLGKGRVGINMGVDENDNVTIYFDDAAYWTTIP